MFEEIKYYMHLHWNRVSKKQIYIFKPVNPKEVRFSEPDNADPDYEAPLCENNNDKVTLSGRNEKYKEVDTIHKKYSERPKSLKNMCLAQFAISYCSVNAVPEDTVWNKNASFKEGSMLEFGT